MKKALADYPLHRTQDLIWGDMDALGHVNNTVFFRYFEDMRIAFLEEIGLMKLCRETNCGPVIASTQCRFKAPLVYPDKITLGTRVTELQKDRFTMEYIVYSHGQEKVSAIGDALVVFYDFNKAAKADIPENLLAAIRQQ